MWVCRRRHAPAFFSYILEANEKATEAAFSKRERNSLIISAWRFLVHYRLINRERNF